MYIHRSTTSNFLIRCHLVMSWATWRGRQPGCGRAAFYKQPWKQNTRVVLCHLASAPEKLLGFERDLTPRTLFLLLQKWESLVVFDLAATKEPFRYFSPWTPCLDKKRLSNSVHEVITATTFKLQTTPQNLCLHQLTRVIPLNCYNPIQK